jgi:hypothetical protein
LCACTRDFPGVAAPVPVEVEPASPVAADALVGGIELGEQGAPSAPPPPDVPGALRAASRQLFQLELGAPAWPSELSASAAQAARYFLAHAPSGFSPDCAGFVAATFHRIGVPIGGSPAWMWERAVAAGGAHHRALPSPGDIAFFDNTYDKDHDGAWDDPLTHVGVVLTVDPASGDLLLAHGGASGGRRELLRMNLLHPSDPDHNDGLRRPTRGDPADAPRLAGQLWVGFATVRPADLPVWLGLTERPVATPE